MPDRTLPASFGAGGAGGCVKSRNDNGHLREKSLESMWLSTCCQNIGMVENSATIGTKMQDGARPVTILIIDDNPRSLEYLSSALAQDGVRIFTASNGKSGLDLVYAHRPQIVLSDLAMPVMGGLDVLRYVKEFDPKIDVLIMSAHESGGSPASALKQGATDYLRKPIALAVLRERVGHLIQNHATGNS